MFETTMTVPTRHLPEIMTRLSKAGFTLLDTGHRVMTEDGPEGEATIRLMHIPTVEVVDPDTMELGVAP
jgi:hypothetical protein